MTDPVEINDSRRDYDTREEYDRSMMMPHPLLEYTNISRYSPKKTSTNGKSYDPSSSKMSSQSSHTLEMDCPTPTDMTGFVIMIAAGVVVLTITVLFSLTVMTLTTPMITMITSRLLLSPM